MKRLKYISLLGTAGFRYDADKLPFIVFRCAYVASLRARQLNCCIGMMITASHNPMSDNGVKLVDPSGDMLNKQWEVAKLAEFFRNSVIFQTYAMEIVNATDEEFPAAVRALEKQISVSKTFSSRVTCGIDTRFSGPHLKDAALAGARLFNVHFEYVGIVTTPMLHYIVKCHNEPDFAPPTRDGYYKSITDAFKQLYELTNESQYSK